MTLLGKLAHWPKSLNLKKKKKNCPGLNPQHFKKNYKGFKIFIYLLQFLSICSGDIIPFVTLLKKDLMYKLV
jgi:hypothetical protein